MRNKAHAIVRTKAKIEKKFRLMDSCRLLVETEKPQSKEALDKNMNRSQKLVVERGCVEKTIAKMPSVIAHNEKIIDAIAYFFEDRASV